MTFEPKNYDHLLGTPGFSDQLLKNHFTLYQGYVKNINTIAQELKELREAGKTATPAFAELNRRFGWEFNGMRLHELYFGNMKNGGSKLDSASKLWLQMDKDFGPKPAWRDDFKAIGSMRGIGWVILYHDSEADKLFNVWVSEHDMGHLAGCAPLLILDVFEHAYILDYGLKKADYIEAFFQSIDWVVVEERFKGLA